MSNEQWMSSIEEMSRESTVKRGKVEQNQNSIENGGKVKLNRNCTVSECVGEVDNIIM
jgi:hypothetical protein